MVKKPGILEQHNRMRGISTGMGQVTGEGWHADIEEQAQFEDEITELFLWQLKSLGQKSTSFTKIIQGSEEAFTDFSERLVAAVNKAISDPEMRLVLMKTLAPEGANMECMKVTRPLMQGQDLQRSGSGR